jgi:hypothetical protein
MFFAFLTNVFSTANHMASAANKASQVLDEKAGDYLEIQQHEQTVARDLRAAARSA